ncbi:MAG: tRNA (adenosine(37)-N6)-threonylcarbamoyltransferase complex dimerization subunit type 1 TsaB [Cytophagales bacterium]|nr:MAG: tRNA (adenosine(37)-N6)-threonylcarbamoyltransferase complex dimerization subunit type 1 TsaB [Cytophagales bacterium]
MSDPQLLLIETSSDICEVAISKGTQIIQSISNPSPKSHAQMILSMINQLLNNHSSIDAIAISIGPGSYTGLRIGVATAKGIALAKNIPIISVNTLESMTNQAIVDFPDYEYYLPMIDARRLEVYTTLYNKNLQQLEPIQNILLNEPNFTDQLLANNTFCFGSGAQKLELLEKPINFNIETNNFLYARSLLKPSLIKYLANDFLDLDTFEPFYLKEFYMNKKS